ncbi:MAG TPA: OstA-like protein [Saprospiraceae bacterium]|nr:OstA-like protein [Saprospiraceae bacterium]
MPLDIFSQEVQDTTSDKVHIDHADIVIGETVGAHEFLYLKGNVELSQDSVYLYCDSAHVIDKREVAAFGNVIIQKGDSLQVYADTLLYFADTRMADLKGEVALIHGGQQLWTTHLVYDMNLNIARYNEPAELIDGTTQLASKQGAYWVDTEEALFIDSVVVIDPEFNMISDSLRYNASSQIARFIAPTWIFQDGATVYCEAGFYNLVDRKAVFRENAEYIKDNQRAWADLITYDGVTREVRLIGNAYYVEDLRRAHGDTIRYNEETGNVRIAGHAEFQDAGRYMQSAKSITYNRTTESLSTEGRGVLTEGTQIIAADHFRQESGIGFVSGNVVFRDTAAQVVLESDHGEYIKETGYLKAYGTSRPLLKTLIDADTLFMTADTLISHEVRDTIIGDTIRSMTGYHDVRIFRGTMQGLCDSLTFDGRDSIFRMYGDPVLWSDTTQFIADTIDLHLRNKALEKVTLRNNGLIISSVQKLFYNQIKGKRIVAEIEENEIQEMHVTGNAESIYYAQDDEQAFLGVNRVASSEIYFVFQESKIDQIKFTTKPSGTMTPMNQVDHQLMRLDGFVWREETRPKDLQDLF